MPVEVSAPIDTHEMVVVHRMFRRESRLLAELVAACEPGDRARCRVLVDHLRDYCLALHLHHSAEDELLWPKLLARLDQEADVVLRMEAAHERISSTLDVVTAAADAWEATPASRSGTRWWRRSSTSGRFSSRTSTTRRPPCCRSPHAI